MALKQLLDLTGKNALITGGSRGLGLQIASGYGEMGARVVISARKADELEDACQQLRAMGIEASLAIYFVAIPVVLLIMLLPITINGLGTGQAAFLWTFGEAGVGRPEALALSILFIALGILGNLPRGVIYAMGGRRPTGLRACCRG